MAIANNNSAHAVSSLHDCALRCSTPCQQAKPDTPRFLVTLDVGIGDAVAIGLSAIDQMVEDDPLTSGTIDVLCNELQSQVLACDPRINRIITTSKLFFPGTHISQWLRGILLDPEAAHVVHFLRQRRYEAVFPSIVAPGLYFRLHSHMLYPQVPDMVRNFLAFHRQSNLHVSTIARQMIHPYFSKAVPALSSDRDIPLYLSSEYVRRAMKTLTALKSGSPIGAEDCKLLLVAPDTASAVTRPPLDLLIEALSMVLAACPHLIICVLPGYTEPIRSFHLLKALAARYPHRVILLPAEPGTHLLEITALIDLADIFVTGDTGVMHLAAAQKRLRAGDDARFAPTNAVKIIALFGGTSPSYFGYSRRTTIVGRGRKEQAALRPGFSKESYNVRGRNLFDHITPQQVANAIL